MVGFLCINCSKDVRESYGSRDGRMVLIGPMFLAFSAWFISVPSAVYGLFWCLSWIVPKSFSLELFPHFLAYPFYIILWTGSALAAIAAISRPLGVAAILLGLVSVFWPRTPLLVSSWRVVFPRTYVD